MFIYYCSKTMSKMEGNGMGKTPQRVVDLLKAEIPAKISLNQFCKQTGINPNSVDKYTAGIAEPTIASLDKLSAYFGKSVGELLGIFPIDFNTVKPVALCAECGGELQASPEGFFRVLQDGTEEEGDGILRLWPCETCCKK
jgi:transcriptional regulator with XRE-family HTH domain